MKKIYKRIPISLVVLLAAIAGTVFGVKGYMEYRRQKVRKDWAKTAIEDIKVFTQDETKVEAELKFILDSIQRTPYTDSGWYSRRMILMADGSWLVYRQTCHKRKPHIQDLFIGYSSDGEWYYSSCHFCVDMIAFNMCQDYQPEKLGDLQKGWHLQKFDGQPEQCMAETAVFPDTAAIDNNRPGRQ